MVSVIIITIIAVVFTGFLIVNLSASNRSVRRVIEHKFTTKDPQMLRVFNVLLGPPLLEGNKVTTLLNGEQIFPAMLGAIRNAQHTITFETYIYWSESIGKEFADALCERAGAGVKVHVLLDWVGSLKMEQKYLDELEACGAVIQRYHKPTWYNLSKMNNRTHRKLLIIDGKIGFTGGVGIADQWLGNAQDEEHWRDTHFEIHGPVVAQMQAVFMDNWIKAKGMIYHTEEYFPKLTPVGSYGAQMFSSSPTNGNDSMHLMYMLLLSAAEKSIEIANSYFVPDNLTIKTLIQAAKRGVAIRIITPGKIIDTKLVRRASQAQWGKLLKMGIRIAEFQPTMYHCKVMIVDDFIVSVGSTNFDDRSFRLNDEANLNVVDKEFARQQLKIFDEDWAKSKEATYATWRKRPLKNRIMERFATLFRKQL